MGCSTSTEAHVGGTTSVPPNTSHSIHYPNSTKGHASPSKSNTNSSTARPSLVNTACSMSADVDWKEFSALVPFRDQFFIIPDDLTIIRTAPSNYLKTEVGILEGKSVLIKFADMGQSTDVIAKSRKALVSEIMSMVRIHHPNIVEFKGFTISPEKGLTCITENMEGKTLRVLLDNKKRFDKLTWEVEKIKYAIDICSALVYMHSLKPTLIHRNIKASKVLLNKNGTMAKLSGFGVSRDRTFEKEMTNKIGDVEWSAPELIMVDEDYTEKVDVYSFGVLLTELDTGAFPLADVKATMHATAFTNKVVAGSLRPKLSPECPPVIVQIVKSCLQLDPHLRPSSGRILDMLLNAKDTLAATAHP
ncbi:Aste57867_19715 [Aphanomyces stellatus]|uniref:Aste57867_19715 protein n=1 Tax=Aphanomyces stellatus TaxID=120398 RepID=A0A485LDV8_9STRA|nr:hypothetical protein As57867_019650 [Aphanomyces stellatus]VFT96414.1 Aste57867_19715 [Aphanomyces stellatus]